MQPNHGLCEDMLTNVWREGSKICLFLIVGMIFFGIWAVVHICNEPSVHYQVEQRIGNETKIWTTWEWEKSKFSDAISFIDEQTGQRAVVTGTVSVSPIK